MNNFFLHLAYVFLTFPFFLRELLYIRYSLNLAFICFLLWSVTNKMSDKITLVWNFMFLIINTSLIIIELRQYGWNPFPFNPLKNFGRIFDLSKVQPVGTR